MSARSVALLSAAIVLCVGLPYVWIKHGRTTEQPVTSEQAQQFDYLWHDLEELLGKAEQLGGLEFRDRVIARTTEFLEFDAAATARFDTAVDTALGALHDARGCMAAANRAIQSSGDLESEQSIRARRDVWADLQTAEYAAADGLLEVLGTAPRERLLAGRRMLWLLRLDYGVRP